MPTNTASIQVSQVSILVLNVFDGSLLTVLVQRALDHGDIRRVLDHHAMVGTAAEPSQALPQLLRLDHHRWELRLFDRVRYRKVERNVGLDVRHSEIEQRMSALLLHDCG